MNIPDFCRECKYRKRRMCNVYGYDLIKKPPKRSCTFNEDMRNNNPYFIINYNTKKRGV